MCEVYECAPNCYNEMVLNGICDTACQNSDCGDDEVDCSACPQQCTALANDFTCDLECYDNPNCSGEVTDCTCANTCAAKKGDGFCDQECNNSICDNDGGDCT